MITKLTLLALTALCVIALVLAVPAAAQKKSAVKVEYHKFEDATCASVSLGQIPLTSFWDRVASPGVLFVDATYCSSGKILKPPAIIQLSFNRRNSAAEKIEPSVIFLLDTTDRLTLEGKSEYVGDFVYVKFLVEPNQVLLIAKAKTVEFQITGFAYKLNQKNLAKLKDLAESGAPSTDQLPLPKPGLLNRRFGHSSIIFTLVGEGPGNWTGGR